MNETASNNELPITRELFLEWRSPRLGSANPSVMTNPVWEWLVQTRMDAYQATKLLGGPSACDAGPGWCFDRFGQTTTVLAADSWDQLRANVIEAASLHFEGRVDPPGSCMKLPRGVSGDRLIR